MDTSSLVLQANFLKEGWCSKSGGIEKHYRIEIHYFFYRRGVFSMAGFFT